MHKSQSFIYHQTMVTDYNGTTAMLQQQGNHDFHFDPGYIVILAWVLIDAVEDMPWPRVLIVL